MRKGCTGLYSAREDVHMHRSQHLSSHLNLLWSSQSQVQWQLMLAVQRINVFLSYCLPLLSSFHLPCHAENPLDSSTVPFSSHLSVCAQTTSQLLSVGAPRDLYFCCFLQKQLSFQGLTHSFVWFCFVLFLSWEA